LGANIKIGKNLKYHSNTGVVLPWLQRKMRGGLYMEWKTDALRGIYGTIWGNTVMGQSKKCRKPVKCRKFHN